MNLLTLLAAVPILEPIIAAIPVTLAGWMHVLFIVAIAAVIIWGICALYQWARSKGLVIPQPVVIIFWCLLAIFLIVLLFQLFGFAVP